MFQAFGKGGLHLCFLEDLKICCSSLPDLQVMFQAFGEGGLHFTLLKFCCSGLLALQVMFQAFGEGEFTPLLHLSGVQAAPLPQEAVAEPSEAKIDLYIQ